MYLSIYLSIYLAEIVYGLIAGTLSSVLPEDRGVIASQTIAWNAQWENGNLIPDSELYYQLNLNATKLS